MVAAKEEEETMGNLKQQLIKLFDASLKLTVPDEPSVKPLVEVGKFEDYQCNNAMGLWSKVKGKGTQFTRPLAIAQAIVTNLPTCDMVESCSVAQPGYVNVVLSAKWMAKSIENMLINGIETWAPTLSVKIAVVDFSSPNIAKKMHVGHLRSTIIGDTIARMLEYSNVEVLRRNHVGDWGTQFGMLIEYLFEKFPDSATETAIENIQALYKPSKMKFDADPEFKQKAQKAVVRLQGEDPVYHKTWEKLCEISRNDYAEIYQRLQVELEEKGESYYKPYIADMIEELNSKGLVEESDGAQVMFIKDFKTPCMLVKSDGGFTYDTTDLAALWYRLNKEEAEWIIYVTDAGQQEHFDRFFKAARQVGWLPENDETCPRVSHVKFGVVKGEDGKRFRNRDREIVPLADLLDEAKTRSKDALIERAKDKEWTPEELDQTAEAIGYGAVKYADMKKNISTDYRFSYDEMLSDKGNTAVYLLYAHARICSIIQKSGKDIDELKKTGNLVLDHANERALGLHLLQFAETVEEACTKLLPHLLCEYLYDLSEHYTKFYSTCQVNCSAKETSRLLLCEATAVVMRKCFHLLGITPVYKI
ncbi:PREDICTED: arginine--tRNA ligase, chloroplastic/mitochondrial-like [Camelina sativa]|uniref:arginine--tRNA ligase n=1 Tax=Camelina sativa TaxID=90675 RepID=A0ABM0W3P7_CAMSA|nr:PREDICTED: arginine--tRNA ligase, chloroplastic/mitochondrial-like [Camelina sativa]